jgi:hypothetical protein
MQAVLPLKKSIPPATLDAISLRPGLDFLEIPIE